MPSNKPMTITSNTKLITLLTSTHNGLSSAIHNAAYESLKADLIYLPITTNDIKNSVAGMRALGIRGSSVSIPYKETVMQFLDAIDPIAKKIGAVNTIVNNNGILTGYNTDWTGAIKALEEVTSLKNKHVILLGAGGAARAILYGLLQAEAKVTVYNRTAVKAKLMADEFKANYGGSLSSLASAGTYDIVIKPHH
jgi:shikimate dehydrogenase